MSALELPIIEVSGTPQAMGEAAGEALRDDIAAMIDRRCEAAAAYFAQRGVGSIDAMISVGAACLEELESWDLQGWEEHVATAAGAGVDPALLHAAANYSDVRDLVVMPTAGGSDEGCTSVAYPGTATRDGHVLVGQTWDLHPLDVDSVVAMHRVPTQGPETWSVTVAGAPSLIGMNEAGVWVGTTNIKVRGVRIGVCYLNLLHRALRCRDREDAASQVAHAPRAAAHTFLLADAGGAIELECTAVSTVRSDLGTTPIVRTNHCFDAEHMGDEAEPPSSSSLARVERATALTSEGLADVTTVRRLMTDRQDGVDSICRWPEDGELTATNACVVGVPSLRRLEACRGPADRGRWTSLPFAAGA